MLKNKIHKGLIRYSNKDNANEYGLLIDRKNFNKINYISRYGTKEKYRI